MLARHGASLLCVRYRDDEDTREHLKTMELIVRRRSRDATPAAGPGAGGRAAVVASRKVALRIGLRERDLQRRVKAGGGRWDPDGEVWYVRREVAERLGLVGRVVGGRF